MGEPVGGADDERVERVAAVEARAGGDGRVDGMRPLGEVIRPARLGAVNGLAVFQRLVGVERGVIAGKGAVGSRERLRRRDQGVLDIVGWGSDADSQLDLLSEPAAERIGDRSPQMPFDLVLHEAARDRQQGKSSTIVSGRTKFSHARCCGVRE